MSADAIVIPDETEILEAAHMAQARGFYLISNGRRAAISPVIPPGWTRLSVTRKPSEERAP